MIPIYNCENYIVKTIESVLNQTYKNFEIHLIDDFSEDNTWEIIKEYSTNEKIKIYRNDKNLGKYKSVNSILKKTSGDYFFILDGHDILYSNKLELENNILAENPEILCIQSKVKKIDEQTNKIITTDKYNYTSETYSYDVIKKIGYFNENRFGGNIEYLSRFIKFLGENKLCKINKILITALKRIDKMNLGYIYSDEIMNKFIKKMKRLHLIKKKDFFKSYKNDDLEKENNMELDIDFYSKSYLDLENKTTKEIKFHWENIGKKEGRLPNANLFKKVYPNFDFNSYLEINPYNINFKSNYDVYGWIYLNDNADYYEWLKLNGYVETEKKNNVENYEKTETVLDEFIKQNNIKYIYISKNITEKNKFIEKIIKDNKLNIYNHESDSYEKVIFYGLYNVDDYNTICSNNSKVKYLLWSNNYESFKDDNYYDNIFTRILKYYDIKHLIIDNKIKKIFDEIKKEHISIIKFNNTINMTKIKENNKLYYCLNLFETDVLIINDKLIKNKLGLMLIFKVNNAYDVYLNNLHLFNLKNIDNISLKNNDKYDLSICFPISLLESDKETITNFNYIINIYLKMKINVNICVMNTEKTDIKNDIDKFIIQNKINYIFVVNPYNFNLGYLRNLYKYVVNSKKVMFNDIDIPLSEIIIGEMIKKSCKYDIVKPYDKKLINTTLNEKYDIINGNNINYLKNKKPNKLYTITGGITLFDKKVLLETGGYEEFNNYGYEDRCLDVVVLYKKYKIYKFNYIIYHLYHPTHCINQDKEQQKAMNYVKKYYGCLYNPNNVKDLHEYCNHVYDYIEEKIKFNIYNNANINKFKNNINLSENH
jgi:glycosyltransferase involved in cell wall biosynthesis